MDFTDIFGTITPAMMIGLVYIIVGQVKKNFNLAVWQLWIIALLLSGFFVGLLGVIGFGVAEAGIGRILQQPEAIIVLLINAIVFSVMGALMALGLYNVESNVRSGRLRDRAGKVEDDGFPV